MERPHICWTKTMIKGYIISLANHHDSTLASRQLIASINKTKSEIDVSEILLDLEQKINLTEKLIKSIIREEKIIQRKIDKSYIKIKNTEEEISNIPPEPSLAIKKQNIPSTLLSKQKKAMTY